MYKSKIALFALLILVLCSNFATAISSEERRKKSEAADKSIDHITPAQFKKTVLKDNSNLWIVFYGSKTCKFTQEFNPKWLTFQKNIKKNTYGFGNNVKVAKIECGSTYFGKDIYIYRKV